MRLLLASSSPYRRSLLERLRLPFAWASPAIDESPRSGERVQEMVQRLALAKARALAPAWPDTLIIASDQSCLLDGVMLGKPHTVDRAREQLRASSGRKLVFHTSLVLYNSAKDTWQAAVDTFSVQFRVLDAAEIEYYLRVEQPLDCAGSFKVEGLGIALFTALGGEDYHSLVGLPLLRLCEFLRQAGFNPLSPTASEPD